MNKKKWIDGWLENYINLISGMNIHDALVPCYFGKYPFSRIFGQLVSRDVISDYNLEKIIQSPVLFLDQAERRSSLEYTLYRLMIEILIFEPFFLFCRRKCISEPTILDLGAGTCHNIVYFNSFLRSRGLNPSFISTDWSDTPGSICEYLEHGRIVEKIEYAPVDYFDKKTRKSLEGKKIDLLFSVASLEQIESNLSPFLCFLESCGDFKKIHIEPIVESLDSVSQLDLQSAAYMASRRYLRGFLGSIMTLEMKLRRPLTTKIFRTGLGSLFIDGYTYLSWI